MIRGYRWKKREGQEYLVRVSNRKEVATVYSVSSQWSWCVRSPVTFRDDCQGFTETRGMAKAEAERVIRILYKPEESK